MCTAKFYKERGLEVMIVYPKRIPGMNKVDFNDVLKHLGSHTIRITLQAAEARSQQLSMTIKPNELTNLSKIKSRVSYEEQSIWKHKN